MLFCEKINNMIIKKNIIKISSIIIVFILILIPSLHIPMHSDDYVYTLMGNGFSGHIGLYLNWSGRFITDYISTILLSLNYYVREIINSIIFTLLILFISLIPVVADSKDNLIWKKFNPIIFFLIFILYWIANPALGETSFWIVGSANYMWTNLFITIYLFLLFYCIKKKNIFLIDKLLLIFFSLLAGCSNENTGLIVALISLSIYFYLDRKNKLILFTFIGNLLGYLVLILAPGNYVRIEKTGGAEWYSLPLMERIKVHLFERIPASVNIDIKIIFFILLIFIIFYVAYKKVRNKNLNNIVYILCFFIGSIFTILILVGSPGIAFRSLNGTLVLLLITASFIFFILSKTKFTSINIIMLIGVLFIFIPSYIYFYNAIYYTNKQDSIRKEIIMKAKANNEKVVNIPKFYFTHLWKDTDKFDLYFNGIAMAKCYDLNEIVEYPVFFNYVKNLQKEKFLDVNWDMGNGVIIDRIIIFKDTPFTLTLFFRMNNDFLDKLPENMGLYIHEYKIYKTKNVSHGWENIFKYDNYFYKSTEVSSNLDKIQIGIFIYNKETDSYKNINVHEITGDLLRTTLKK